MQRSLVPTAGLKLGREACSVISSDLTHCQPFNSTPNPQNLQDPGGSSFTTPAASAPAIYSSSLVSPAQQSHIPHLEYAHPKPRLFRLRFTMLSYRYSGLPLPEAGKHIRLLRLSPGEFSDDLHVELEQVLLDTASNYEALSYVWGSTAHPVSVLVGPSREHAISVTQNLATALRYLRDVNESQILWADAICINQSNLAERSYQVTLMSDIFRAASRVTVWLGPEEQDSSYAFSAMHAIGSSIDVDWTHYSFKPKLSADNASSSRLEEPHNFRFRDREVHAINRLLHRQWFQRLWVRQEITLATQAVICCGRLFMPWVLFRNAIFFIYSQGRMLMAEALGDQIASFASRINLVYKICEKRVYLLENLRADLAHVVCAEPRDKLYGMLSLLRPNQQNIGIVPDYTRDVALVYQDATMRFISYTKRLSMLLGCELQGTSPHMPTWVPNWSMDLRTAPISGGQNHPSAMFESITTSKGEGVLSVAGAALATIHSVQPMHFGVSEDEDGFQNMLTLLWKIVISNPATSNEKEISQLSAVCDALCSGLFRHATIPAREYDPEFKSAMQSFKSISTRSSLFPVDVDSADDRASYQRTVRHLCRNRSFFVTTEGSVGIAPLSARPGDIVCVLLGCYSAILLRQTGKDTYQVVGQTYMSGANTGEVLLGPLPGHLRRVFCYDDEIKRYRDALWDEHTEQVQFRDPRLDKLLLNPGFQVRDQGENRVPIIKTSVEALQNAGIAAQYFDLV